MLPAKNLRMSSDSELFALIVDLLIEEEDNLSDGYNFYSNHYRVILENIAYRIVIQKEDAVMVLRDTEPDLSDGYHIYCGGDVKGTLERISRQISFLITASTTPKPAKTLPPLKTKREIAAASNKCYECTAPKQYCRC